jgi:Tfp pilus assembly protein PilN
VQLTSLLQKGTAIEIKGTSVSNEVISQFLRALDSTKSFETVYLQDIEAAKEKPGQMSGVVLKDFKLTARLTSLVVEDPKAQKSGNAPKSVGEQKPEGGT